MKKWMLAFALAAVLNVESAELPKSIELESGNVKLRLDARKRWNINRVEWKQRLLGIDTAGAHYGMAFQPANSPFFIGSGHDESGKTEKVLTLKIFADGKEVLPAGQKISGKQLRMEKVSRVEAFTVKYSFTLENDILAERTELTASEDVRVNFMYCFMHPWSVRFKEFHALRPDGLVLDLTFRSDESFPSRVFLPAAAWYDPASGLALATVITLGKGIKNPQRYIWDRREYRKDYLCIFAHSVFPGGQTAVCRASTVFFQQPDRAKWQADADKVFEVLLHCAKLQENGLKSL